jgi:hypothetical protein
MKRVSVLTSLLILAGGLLAGCGGESAVQTPAAREVVRDALTGGPYPSLLMVQAQFIDEVGPDGKSGPKPGPAKLVLIRMTDNGWKEVVLEDPLSNVFHKALPYNVEGEEPGILTIGANQAALKVWRYSSQGGWQDTMLWNPVFGGKWDRLRDIEIGDVTGDGVDEMVIATHDQGVVAVAMRSGDGWKIEEMSRTPSTFVHEVEIGDVDGDGLNEFFTTPSEPNRASGHSQPGHVHMYKWNGTGFDQSVVDEFEGSHAKEILAADMNGDGISELFSVVEAETEKEGKDAVVLVPVQIKRYRFSDKGEVTAEVVASLQDRQCRFLCAGDVNGDGLPDLVAAAMKSGLWVFWQGESGEFTAEQVDADSSGFEHTTYLSDLDGDGQLEIYVAADDQHEVRSYSYRDGAFKRSLLVSIPADHITWNLSSGSF